MKAWAEHEVELACKKENPDWDGKSFDYGCACYQSALKAYESLMEDEHSGVSFAFTKSILIRLMNRLPLTPITEDDFKDVPNLLRNPEEEDGDVTQQCPRMSGLFRNVDKNGNVTFNDVDRIICYNTSSECGYHSEIINAVINMMFPITLPYWPPAKKFEVFTEEFLVDPANGDFDTVGILYCIKPDSTRVEINRYFTLRNDQMVEISKEEYDSLKEKAVKPDQARQPEATMQPEIEEIEEAESGILPDD